MDGDNQALAQSLSASIIERRLVALARSQRYDMRKGP